MPKAIAAFIDDFANTASVVSFFITIIGFTLTLWRLSVLRRETERVKIEARREIDRVSGRFFLLEINALYDQLQAVDYACARASWQEVAFRCDQIRSEATRLILNPHLMKTEQDRFRAIHDEFEIVIEFVRKNRLKKNTSAKDLPEVHRKTLGNLKATLLRVQSRFHHTDPGA